VDPRRDVTINYFILLRGFPEFMTSLLSRGFSVPKFLAEYVDGTPADVITWWVFPVVTSLMENNPIGAVIASVTAIDRDRGVNGRVTYSLEPGAVTRWITLDRVAGTIRAKVRFGRRAFPVAGHYITLSNMNRLSQFLHRRKRSVIFPTSP